MKLKFDAERAREVLKNPEQSGLDDVELAVLSTCLDLAEGTGQGFIIDDTQTPKKKRKPRPSRIKRSKRK
jgi:hypothetical protein